MGYKIEQSAEGVDIFQDGIFLTEIRSMADWLEFCKGRSLSDEFVASVYPSIVARFQHCETVEDWRTHSEAGFVYPPKFGLPTWTWPAVNHRSYCDCPRLGCNRSSAIGVFTFDDGILHHQYRIGEKATMVAKIEKDHVLLVIKVKHNDQIREIQLPKDSPLLNKLLDNLHLRKDPAIQAFIAAKL